MSDIDSRLVLGIRECSQCGKTGDDDEEYGVRGIARIGGNLCVECAWPRDTPNNQADDDHLSTVTDPSSGAMAIFHELHSGEWIKSDVQCEVER